MTDRVVCDAQINRHVFTEQCMGSVPWCDCGKVRNGFYRRTWLDKLLGRPKPTSHEG